MNEQALNDRIAKEQEAALVTAISRGDVQAGVGLLRHGVSANAKTDWGSSMLAAAVIANSVEFVEALLEHGADPNAKGHHGITALAEAIFAGKGTRIAEVLLDAGAHLDSPCYSYVVPLDLAVRKANEPMILLLLERGSKVPEHMRAPQYWACRHDIKEEIERLIASHALTQGIDSAMAGSGISVVEPTEQDSENRPSSGIMKIL